MLNLPQDTFFKKQDIDVEIILQNLDKKDFVYASKSFFKDIYFLIKRDKKVFRYYDPSCILGAEWKLHRLKPGERIERRMKIYCEFINTPGEYSIQAIFEVKIPMKQKGNKITKVKKIKEIKSPVRKIYIIQGEGRKDYEEFKNLLEKDKPLPENFLSPYEFISFINKFPKSPFVIKAYLEAIERFFYPCNPGKDEKRRSGKYYD